MKQITVKIKWRQGKLDPRLIKLCIKTGLPLIQVLEVTEPKHDCETWQMEGMGCSICGNSYKHMTIEELKQLQEHCNGMITSLTEENEKLKSQSLRVEEIKKAMDCLGYEGLGTKLTSKEIETIAQAVYNGGKE